MTRGIIALAIGATLACTWVPLTKEGENVRILRSTEVTQCKKLGTGSSKTTDRVIVFARTERKVREELEALARNEAAELGGDSVVPIGTPAGGRQSFEIYRCSNP